jgi:putative oxidoreductase
LLGPLRRVVAAGRRLAPLQPYWVAVVRAAVGVFFCISGATKLLQPGARQQMVQTLASSGIPFPELNAVFVSLVELICGGLLALGLLTSLSAVLLGGNMLVAIVTNRLPSVHGDSAFAWLDDFLYLPEVLYALILGWLLFAGPGKPSLDALLAPAAHEADAGKRTRN